MDEQQIRAIIREELGFLIKSDRFTISRLVQFSDGKNIQLGLTTGTKIGTSALQKLGFYDTTPVVQQSETSSNSNEAVENSGTTLNSNSTSTGSIGSSKYRFAQVVATLKRLGFLAS